MTSEMQPITSKPLPPVLPNSLFGLIGEAFGMLLRYFLLIYPVFLYFIIYAFAISPLAHITQASAGMWIILLGMAAIYLLFSAGWNRMMLLATTEWQTMVQCKRDGKPIPTEIGPVPYKLFKDFIPGIGEFGPSFLIGGVIVCIAYSLILGGLIIAGTLYIGFPNALMQAAQTQNTMTPQQADQLISQCIHQLSAHQIQEWQILGITVLIAALLLNALTLFWQQFILIKNSSPIRALGQSATLAFRRPLQTFLIICMMPFSYFLIMGTLGMTPLATFLNMFFMIVLFIFFELFKYLYVIRTEPPAAPSL